MGVEHFPKNKMASRDRFRASNLLWSLYNSTLNFEKLDLFQEFMALYNQDDAFYDILKRGVFINDVVECNSCNSEVSICSWGDNSEFSYLQKEIDIINRVVDIDFCINAFNGSLLSTFGFDDYKEMSLGSVEQNVLSAINTLVMAQDIGCSSLNKDIDRDALTINKYVSDFRCVLLKGLHTAVIKSRIDKAIKRDSEKFDSIKSELNGIEFVESFDINYEYIFSYWNNSYVYKNGVPIYETADRQNKLTHQYMLAVEWKMSKDMGLDFDSSIAVRTNNDYVIVPITYNGHKFMVKAIASYDKLYETRVSEIKHLLK